MREQDFQTKVKRDLERQGFKVLKIIQLSENGYPDLLALKDGKAVFIEVKGSKGRLSKLQEYRIKQLRDMGFEAYCLRAN